MHICEIKRRLKTGDIVGAESVAKESLAAEPDNVQVKMLYGTCRQLQGDETTFCRIHDELAPKMATVADGDAQSFWRRYHALWISLIVGGLVVAGLGAVVVYYGNAISKEFSRMAYAGPVQEKLERQGEGTNAECSTASPFRR